MVRAIRGPWAGRGGIAWLVWIPMAWCSLIFCILFSCPLANKRITLCMLNVFFLSAYERALGTLETGSYCSHAKSLSSRITWTVDWSDSKSPYRGNSSQLQQGLAVWGFCMWNASMIKFDCSLGLWLYSRIQFLLRPKHWSIKKITINSLIYEIIKELKCCLQGSIWSSEKSVSFAEQQGLLIDRNVACRRISSATLWNSVL